MNKFLIVCGGAARDLLGQSRALGMRGEIQVDLSGQIRTDIPSLRFNSVALDQPLPVVATLLHWLRREAEQGNLSQAAARHALFLADEYVGNHALHQAAASPAIAAAMARHPQNQANMQAVFRTLLQDWTPEIGPDDPLRVWIVSACAGGVGAGVHRAVAEALLNMLEMFPEARTEINMIQIGSTPYAHRTANAKLNTFMSVAADSTFHFNMRKNHPGLPATLNWFYLDFPQLGTGDATHQLQKQVIEIASKTLMLDVVDHALQGLFVHDSIRLVRVGPWIDPFAWEMVYSEVLHNLIGQLDRLVEPPAMEYLVAGQPQPTFVAGSTLESIISQVSEPRFTSEIRARRWKLPKFKSPIQLSELEALIQQWGGVLNTLLGADLFALGIAPYYQIEERRGSGKSARADVMPLYNAPEYDGGDDWFVSISRLHRARAWAVQLLGLKTHGWTADGLCQQLIHQATLLSAESGCLGLIWQRQEYARKQAGLLADFVTTLAQVHQLLSVYYESTAQLSQHIQAASRVREFAKGQLSNSQFGGQPAIDPILIVANLWDAVNQADSSDWLHLLQGEVEARNFDGFRQQVLNGAVGLTRMGLRRVLGITEKQIEEQRKIIQQDDPAENDDSKIYVKAEIECIKNELNSRVGRIIDTTGKEVTAIWWNETTPITNQVHSYRVLPGLQLGLIQMINRNPSPASASYLHTQLGGVGLSVVGLEVIGLSKSGDRISTPRFLLQSLLHDIQQMNWVVDRYQLALAGAIGEPLDLQVLLAAGVTPPEIEVIQQFYQTL